MRRQGADVYQRSSPVVRSARQQQQCLKRFEIKVENCNFFACYNRAMAVFVCLEDKSVIKVPSLLPQISGQ